MLDVPKCQIFHTLCIAEYNMFHTDRFISAKDESVISGCLYFRYLYLKKNQNEKKNIVPLLNFRNT